MKRLCHPTESMQGNSRALSITGWSFLRRTLDYAFQFREERAVPEIVSLQFSVRSRSLASSEGYSTLLGEPVIIAVLK